MLENIKQLKRKIEAKINPLKQELRQIIVSHSRFTSHPQNHFTLQGYELINNFWPQEECNRLISLANLYLKDESYVIDGNCYLICRKDVQKIDTKVQVITNIQEIDNALNQFFHNGIIEKLFEERIGYPMKVKSLRLQVDNLDTKTKRGFHTDGLGELYKAFIYLTDVDEYGDGPYTIVPGSHNHKYRHIFNHLYNRLSIFLTGDDSYPRGDMSFFYSNKKAISFFGKAGTLILSNQQLAHKGWQQHDRKKRYVLVCDVVPLKNYNGKPMTLGLKEIQTNSNHNIVIQ
ncbi:MAG: hypothetical protein QNJ33_07085 [Crocosphaera sp.]|nr:hypothetical protein [Crocosphaera sp.]